MMTSSKYNEKKGVNDNALAKYELIEKKFGHFLRTAGGGIFTPKTRVRLATRKGLSGRYRTNLY